MSLKELINKNKLSYNYSLASALLLSFYGISVCPYIDSLADTTVLFVFVMAFSIHAIVITLAGNILIRPAPPANHSRLQFIIELTTYIATGIGLTLFNLLAFDFPLESGLKVITGTIAIGLFASMDSALHTERRVYANTVIQNVTAGFFPVSRKLAIFFSTIMILTAVIMILVLYKDTQYLIKEYAHSPETVKRAFFLDVLFIMSIFMLFGLRVLHSYSINMKLLFNQQLKAMKDVSTGNLAAQVPVATKDEFGLIAQQTNLMIDGLREKEHIASTFGKVVSPLVARQLLNSNLDDLHKGVDIQVALLFCDIRGFTTFSETEEASAVVDFLNQYFTDIVTIIDKHHGVVDKFIGDAVLAVFGLDRISNEPCYNAIESAVKAALEINQSAQGKCLPTGEPVQHGVGLHAGHVIAGTIGSPQRFEFTVIGDTVNTASRIEGLSKRLSMPLVMSNAVYDALNDDLKSFFVDRGDLPIRGRSEMVHAYAGPVEPGISR